MRYDMHLSISPGRKLILELGLLGGVRNKYIKPEKLKKIMVKKSVSKSVSKTDPKEVARVMNNKTKKQMAEEYCDVQTQLTSIIKGFQYFGLNYKYAQDVFTTQTLTIHEEKQKCKKAYSDNGFIQTGVNYLVNIIMGDDPGIESKNEVIEEYGEKWLHFSNYGPEHREAITQAVITGDGYLKKIKGSLGSYKYLNMENSEDMYIDFDWKTQTVKRYIERMYYTTAQAKELKLETFTIQTPRGVETFNGVEYSPDEIIHFRFKRNIWGIYGRSPLSSVLNDVEIIRSMERAAAVISRYKAVPKKVIFPETTNPEEVMDDKAVSKVQRVFEGLQDFESPVIGQKFGSLNLTDGGQAFDLTPYFDYFKRKITAPLSPEFIVHGELVNRATSNEQSQFFYLAVCAIRNYFTGTTNYSVHEGMDASLKVLEDKKITVPKARYKWKWGDYDVELRVEKTNRMQKEWNDGTIKLDEYRVAMGYEQDDDFGEAYKWETGGGESQEETLERVQKLLGEKNAKGKKDV
jgi:hypothetical protein